MKKFWLTALMCLALGAQAQRWNMDSLRKVIGLARRDSAEALALGKLAWGLKDRGAYDSASTYAQRALALNRQLRISRGVIDACNTLATIQRHTGNYPAALNYFLQGLHVADSVKDKEYEPVILSNIGNLYYFEKDYEKALQYQLKAKKMRLELLKRKRNEITIRNLANVIANIGIIYYVTGRPDSSIAGWQQALQLYRECGEIGGETNTLNNIATYYMDKGEHEKALSTFLQTIDKYRQLEDPSGESTSWTNIAELYKRLRKYPESESAAKKSVQLSRGIGELGALSESLLMLSTVYEAMGSYEASLRYYKEHIRMRDSLNNEENTKKQVKLEMQYEFDKKESAARLEQEKKDAVTAAEARRQRIILLSISGFGLLVMGFAIFAYRSFLQKKKATVEILLQKNIIEQKQKEILDSIFYARRIQRCLLPSEKYLRRVLTGRLQDPRDFDAG
jgi:tetratricopeptide (TPR) repeat protein